MYSCAQVAVTEIQHNLVIVDSVGLSLEKMKPESIDEQ